MQDISSYPFKEEAIIKSNEENLSNKFVNS